MKRSFFARSSRLSCHSPEITSTSASPHPLLQGDGIAHRETTDPGVEGRKPLVQPISDVRETDRKLVAGGKHERSLFVAAVYHRQPGLTQRNDRHVLNNLAFSTENERLKPASSAATRRRGRCPIRRGPCCRGRNRTAADAAAQVRHRGTAAPAARSC